MLLYFTEERFVLIFSKTQPKNVNFIVYVKNLK